MTNKWVTNKSPQAKLSQIDASLEIYALRAISVFDLPNIAIVWGDL